MKRVVWTQALDDSLRKARTVDHLTWDEIESLLGITRELCAARAKELGIPTGRLPVPPRAVRRALGRL